MTVVLGEEALAAFRVLLEWAAPPRFDHGARRRP